MMKSKKSSKHPFSKFFPYLFVTITALALFFYGSIYKTQAVASEPIMHSIGNSDYVISPDHISEMHIVADLAYSLDLATKNYITMDYVSVSTQYTINQAGAIKLEKPNIIDTSSLSRGVREYVVADGDNLDAIAARFKLSTDQIRWSNGLKNKNITAGQQLFLPATPGIVYLVKNGDDINALAQRYSSPAEHIIAYNDLETANGLTPGGRIILPGGILPASERPENQRVTPSVIASTPPTYQVYRPQSAGNPLPFGWCTWFAWDWRKKNMPWNYHLPSSGLGDAKYWDENLRGRYHMDKTPRVGAVFQDDFGYYGHVGIVVGVNDDGSIRIADMNGVSGWGRVGETNVPRSKWINWDFIHQARGT